MRTVTQIKAIKNEMVENHSYTYHTFTCYKIYCLLFVDNQCNTLRKKYWKCMQSNNKIHVKSDLNK